MRLMKFGHTSCKRNMELLPIKMTKEQAADIAKKCIENSKKYGLPLKTKKKSK
ncbi:hypothetical protein [Terribacillus sp. DMT04]|uniref:hypothetical protein n=1 Tax=Terribacillus sp. DMT04 TaxID=2850441 RepID=UPI001C2BE4CF|nr:hypothetical protein [Terribacillus sp. DMT04]QXE03569.1 hypothetical protein KS242_17430 [Terribacillus sp. DMT04]